MQRSQLLPKARNMSRKRKATWNGKNDICSNSTSNEQKTININHYVINNVINVESTPGGVYDEILDHSDLEKERERKREQALSK